MLILQLIISLILLFFLIEKCVGTERELKGPSKKADSLLSKKRREQVETSEKTGSGLQREMPMSLLEREKGMNTSLLDGERGKSKLAPSLLSSERGNVKLTPSLLGTDEQGKGKLVPSLLGSDEQGNVKLTPSLLGTNERGKSKLALSLLGSDEQGNVKLASSGESSKGKFSSSLLEITALDENMAPSQSDSMRTMKGKEAELAPSLLGTEKRERRKLASSLLEITDEQPVHSLLAVPDYEVKRVKTKTQRLQSLFAGHSMSAANPEHEVVGKIRDDFDQQQRADEINKAKRFLHLNEKYYEKHTEFRAFQTVDRYLLNESRAKPLKFGRSQKCPCGRDILKAMRMVYFEHYPEETQQGPLRFMVSLKHIGGGGFGKVYHVTPLRFPDNALGECLAIKIPKTDHPRAEEFLTEEARVMSHLKGSKHIIGYIQTLFFQSINDEHQYNSALVMELGLSSLRRFWLRQMEHYEFTGQSIDENNFLQIQKQILIGLVELHKANYVYLDMKTDNVMVMWMSASQQQSAADNALLPNIAGLFLALIDVGGVIKVMSDEPQRMVRNPLTSKLYDAPEMYKFRHTHYEYLISKAADIWSFGMLILTMISLTPPFNVYMAEHRIGRKVFGKNSVANTQKPELRRNVVNAMAKSVISERGDMWHQSLVEFVDFLGHHFPRSMEIVKICLKQNPADRPKARALLYKYYADVDLSQIYAEKESKSGRSTFSGLNSAIVAQKMLSPSNSFFHSNRNNPPSARRSFTTPILGSSMGPSIGKLGSHRRPELDRETQAFSESLLSSSTQEQGRTNGHATSLLLYSSPETTNMARASARSSSRVPSLMASFKLHNIPEEQVKK